MKSLLGPDKPNRLLLAHSLVIPSQSNEVTFHVSNVRLHPIKLFKGSTLGTFIPRNQVMVVADSETPISTTEFEAILPPQININDELTLGQQNHLQKRLQGFVNLFDQNQLGGTSVANHLIHTQGPLIKEPMRRLPVYCKKVVQQEVNEMPENGVIRAKHQPMVIIDCAGTEVQWVVDILYRFSLCECCDTQGCLFVAQN